jgi:hypothetical protein
LLAHHDFLGWKLNPEQHYSAVAALHDEYEGWYEDFSLDTSLLQGALYVSDLNQGCSSLFDPLLDCTVWVARLFH